MGKFKEIEQEMIEALDSAESNADIKQALHQVARSWGLLPEFYEDVIDSLIEQYKNGK